MHVRDFLTTKSSRKGGEGKALALTVRRASAGRVECGIVLDRIQYLAVCLHLMAESVRRGEKEGGQENDDDEVSVLGEQADDGPHMIE